MCTLRELFGPGVEKVSEIGLGRVCSRDSAVKEGACNAVKG